MLNDLAGLTKLTVRLLAINALVALVAFLSVRGGALGLWFGVAVVSVVALLGGRGKIAAVPIVAMLLVVLAYYERDAIATLRPSLWPCVVPFVGTAVLIMAVMVVLAARGGVVPGQQLWAGQHPYVGATGEVVAEFLRRHNTVWRLAVWSMAITFNLLVASGTNS